MKKYQRVAALIDLDAIEENFEAMRAGLPAGTKMAAVVKANGYGHGAVPIARLLESKDAVWGFAAATIEEALALRSYGIRKPVLVLGYVFPDAYEQLVEQEIRPAVFRMDMAWELSREAVRQGHSPNPSCRHSSPRLKDRRQGSAGNEDSSLPIPSENAEIRQLPSEAFPRRNPSRILRNGCTSMCQFPP